MALTITRVVPTPTSRTATATTFVITSLAAGFSPNDMAVLCIACDNSNTAGVAPTVTSVSDTAGNVWNERTDTVHDPGAINAGIANVIYTCNVTNAIATTDDITITFTLTTAAVSLVMYKIANDGVVRGSYVTTATFAGANTTSPAHVTGTITSGDTVFMLQAAEMNQAAPTYDSDTTNGSWSAGATTATTGCTAITQYKTVTGTATQTWNLTHTVADSKGSWISITPLALPVTKGTQIGQAVQRAAVI